MAATTLTSTVAERGGVDETVLGDPALAVGEAVEVRRRFDRAWARGFVIDERTGSGYRLRRTSDGAVLPVAFPAADVRPAPPA